MPVIRPRSRSSPWDREAAPQTFYSKPSSLSTKKNTSPPATITLYDATPPSVPAKRVMTRPRSFSAPLPNITCCRPPTPMLARAAWMEAVGKLQSIPEHDIIPTCLFDEDGVTGGLVVTEPEDLEMDVMVELESVRVLESIMEDDEEEEEEREEMTAVETCGR